MKLTADGLLEAPMTPPMKNKRSRPKCPCPANCKYCGARRKKDIFGHYCGTRNCQWQFGFNTCTLHVREKGE